MLYQHHIQPVALSATGASPSAAPTLHQNRSGVLGCAATLLVAIGLTAGGGLLSATSADEILLVDGSTVEGDIIKDDPPTPTDDGVKVRLGYGSVAVIRHLKQSEIKEIHAGDTPRQARLKALIAERDQLGDKATGADVWKLAERARILGDEGLRRDLAQTTIEHDPDHVAARVLLGYVNQDGEWMSRKQAAIKRGEVFYKKKWMTTDERDALVKAEAEQKAQDEENRRIAEEKRHQQQELAAREVEAQARLAEAQARQAEADRARAEADLARTQAQFQNAYPFGQPWMTNRTNGQVIVVPNNSTVVIRDGRNHDDKDDKDRTHKDDKDGKGSQPNQPAPPVPTITQGKVGGTEGLVTRDPATPSL